MRVLARASRVMYAPDEELGIGDQVPEPLQTPQSGVCPRQRHHGGGFERELPRDGGGMRHYNEIATFVATRRPRCNGDTDVDSLRHG